MAEPDNRRRNQWQNWRRNRGPASLLRMDEVQSFVEKAFTQNKIPEKDIHRFLIAFDEIFSNICRHSGAQEVTVECRVNEERADLVFEDDGMEFNPLTNPRPDVRKPIESRKPGGLGIYMVQKLMDETSYERTDGKNRLTLTKQRKRGIKNGMESKI